MARDWNWIYKWNEIINGPLEGPMSSEKIFHMLIISAPERN